MLIGCEENAACFMAVDDATCLFVSLFQAVNGVGKGEAEEQKVNTASNPSTDLGIILGVSIGGGVILILLIATGITVYNMKNKKKTLKPPIMPDAIDSGNDGM